MFLHICHTVESGEETTYADPTFYKRKAQKSVRNVISVYMCIMSSNKWSVMFLITTCIV